MKSTVSTALKAITSEYLLSSPTTPTDLIGKNTANAWLTGPEYKAWQFGDENSENSIKGSAADWCRVVTGRTSKNFSPTLTVEGEFASKFMKYKHVKI